MAKTSKGVILSQASQIKSDYSFALIKATADNKSLVQDASSAELKVNALVEYSKDSQWDPKKLTSLGFPAGCFLIVDLRGQDIHAADLITNLALVRQYGYQAGVIDDLSTLDDIKALKANQIYLINFGKTNDDQDASLNGNEITDGSGKLAVGMSVKWQRDYTNVDVSGDHAGFVGMGQDTLLKGGNAFGYSTNGRDFNAVITPKGLIFRRPDAERMWRLLKPNEIADINSMVGDKVKKEVDSATAEIPAAVSAANSAVSAAESAVAASKVNSDAIVAQSEAISEAKSAMDSATAEIQQLKANAASDVAQIESTIAEVQTSINQAKSANESAVQAVQAELKSTSDSMDKVEKRLDEVDTSLDAYAKSAAEQGHDITLIKQKQGQFEADFASAQGNVNQIQADIKGLRQNIKDNQGNIATLLTSADKLQASMKDAQNNISNLLLTASEYEQTFKDQDGRLSKVEQTATEHTSELADTKGNLDKVTQKANALQLLLSDAQKNIQNIQLDAEGLHDTLTGQSNQLASLNVTLNSLDSKYSGITGDLQSKQTALSTEQQQTKDMLLNKADKSEVDSVKGTVNQVSAEQKLMADQISSKVSAAEYQKDKTDTITAIQKNSTAIDETNKLVSIKANQTDVDNVKGTAQRLSARLDVMAGEVKSKVDETRVNSIVDGKGYATTSTVQSLVDQKAGTINESITNLEGKFNSSSSVNLAEKTNQGTTNWMCDPGTGTTNLTEVNINGVRGVRFNNTRKTTSWWVAKYVLNLDYFEPNQDYIISFDIRTSSDNFNQGGMLNIARGDSSHPYLANTSFKTNFKQNQLTHVSCTGRSYSSLDKNGETFYLNCAGLGQCDWVDIVNFKIARGKIDKGYSPAPSDNATVTQIQSITASIDGLQSNVTNLENDTSSRITQLSNTFQSKIGDAQIAINDLKDKTLWKVTDSVDLNNAVSQQKLFVRGGSNLPPGTYWWYVQVEPGYGGRIVQYAVSDRDNKHFSRQYDGANWSAWTQDASESEITQLQDAINLRVQKGELLSQINLTAGNTLIQTGKLYLDSSSVVFSGRAFIPSAAISELDADKLTFYGNGSKASIGASVAQYDQDAIKSTINLQYQGGFEIHSSNQLGSILTMHDNTVRLASRSQTYSAGSGKPLDQQYSGFWAGSNHALINAVDSEGKTTGWSIGPSNSNGYRAYLYDSSTSVQPNFGVGIGTQRFDVYAGGASLYLGPDKAELRDKSYTTIHSDTETFIEGGNQQMYMHNGEVNIGNPNDTGNATGVHFQVFGWASFNGYVEGMGWTTKSTLSSKTRIEKLDTKDALNKIMSTDLETYQYKTEVAGGMTKRHAGPIIDDVHDVAQYSTPDEFINERRTGRSDADVIGYLMGAVQELKKQLDKVKEKINYE